jgi:hypothetical protein
MPGLDYDVHAYRRSARTPAPRQELCFHDVLELSADHTRWREFPAYGYRVASRRISSSDDLMVYGNGSDDRIMHTEPAQRQDAIVQGGCAAA